MCLGRNDKKCGLVVIPDIDIDWFGEKKWLWKKTVAIFFFLIQKQENAEMVLSFENKLLDITHFLAWMLSSKSLSAEVGVVALW